METTIYQRIEEIREESKLSLSKFSAICKLPQSTYRTIIKKQTEFTVSTIVNILSEYPLISPDWLLQGIGKKHREKVELSSQDVLIRELLEKNDRLVAENAVLKYQLNQKEK